MYWGNTTHIIELQLLDVIGALVFVLFDLSMFNGRQHGVHIELVTLPYVLIGQYHGRNSRVCQLATPASQHQVQAEELSAGNGEGIPSILCLRAADAKDLSVSGPADIQLC